MRYHIILFIKKFFLCETVNGTQKKENFKNQTIRNVDEILKAENN